MAKTDQKKRYTEASCFRNFTFLMYEDSALENWQTVLQEMNIPCVISPLHHGEKKEDGTNKKPHWHVVITYQQKHSIGQVLDIVEEIHGVPDLRYNYKNFVVGDLKMMLRYLCHLDNDDKIKFPVEEVKVIGSMNYEAAIQESKDVIQTLIDITFFVHENHITCFSEFMCWCGVNNRKWFEIAATSSTYYISTLIKTEAYSDGKI